MALLLLDRADEKGGHSVLYIIERTKKGLCVRVCTRVCVLSVWNTLYICLVYHCGGLTDPADSSPIAGFTFAVVNTGQGLRFHPVTGEFSPQIRYKRVVSIEGIPAGRVQCSAFWLMLLRMMVCNVKSSHLCTG